MIKIQDIKLKVPHKESTLKDKVLTLLHISEQQLKELTIQKCSIDARKKPDIYYIYTVCAEVEDEKTVLKHCQHNSSVSAINKTPFVFEVLGQEQLKNRPVVIGSGPAGLFCTYFLAKYGYQPILLERGADVRQRTADVEKFWNENILDTESNVQFGEGGAGTFSDGKLNTQVKDKTGCIQEILRIFVSHGAPESIIYDAKPHIGTDILVDVVESMRRQMIDLGAAVQFHSKVTDLKISDGKICGVTINGAQELACEAVILAIGHSARDTFEMLYKHQVPMEPKSFAVGLRVEHPQKMIDDNQYGINHYDKLPAAPYKVTAQTKSGRGVYSFCMCPGGYVVNASSEQGRIAVNGMSYYKRDSGSANSAIIISVTPDDFPSKHPLSGMAFQRELEERAYQIGNGKIPSCEYGFFYEKVRGEKHKDSIADKYFEAFPPMEKGALLEQCDLSAIFPKEINESFVQVMEQYERYITGFSSPKTRLYGVESRTSSPVRITRNELFQSEIMGLYPCGEGAGYAGGIMSAAMDGCRTAQKVCNMYKPYSEE